MIRFLSFIAFLSVCYSIFRIAKESSGPPVAATERVATEVKNETSPQPDPVKTKAPASPTRSYADRPKVMLFTGTQWCRPCQHMDVRVIRTPAWRSFAASEIKFQVVNIPRSSALMNSNDRKLVEQYAPEGYPTLVILDGRGREITRRCGASGSPDEVIQWIRSCVPAT